MWRFLLAGLATVGGLILLVLGSLGDPVAKLRDLHMAVPVAAPATSQIASIPRAISAQQSKTAQNADTGAAGTDAPTALTPLSAPIVTPPVDRGPVGYDDDSTAANILFSGIPSGAQAPVRHVGSIAMGHNGRATHTYFSRSQHQGVWLFPPNQLGGGGSQ
jgi:hypothetical protein